MQRYVLYLMQHLAWPTLVITASLTGIIWLTQALRFIDFMLSRGLSAGDFMYLTGLMVPSLLLIVVPVSLLLAVLYVYNRLMGDSELVVFSAVGVSRLQLAYPVMLVGGIAMLFTFLISLYLMPMANQKFRDIRVYFRDQYASVLLEENVFNTPIDGLTVFVRERLNDGIMRGILIQDNRDPAHVVTMMAEEGKLVQSASGPRFLLKRGQRQELATAKGSISWLSFDDYTLDIGFYANAIQRERGADERTLGQLFDTKDVPPEALPALRAEAHQRITWPLYTLALPLMALATLMSSQFNRRGQWKRTLFAAVSAIAIVLIAFSLRNIAVRHPWAIGLMYGLSLGTIAASLAILRSGKFIHIPWDALRHGLMQKVAP
ncbi:MAG: LPS export ABC transporter permease LptF [Alphaproteobacteria bacterium]|nr:LPS export ABC transporter permease LptF [Alphaproteobacteria bacterium]